MEDQKEGLNRMTLIQAQLNHSTIAIHALSLRFKQSLMKNDINDSDFGATKCETANTPV